MVCSFPEPIQDQSQHLLSDAAVIIQIIINNTNLV